MDCSRTQQQFLSYFLFVHTLRLLEQTFICARAVHTIYVPSPPLILAKVPTQKKHCDIHSGTFQCFRPHTKLGQKINSAFDKIRIATTYDREHGSTS